MNERALEIKQAESPSLPNLLKCCDAAWHGAFVWGGVASGGIPGCTGPAL